MSHQALRPLALPLAFSIGLFGLVLLAPVRENATLLWTFLCIATLLCASIAGLAIGVRRGQRTLTLNVVLRKQHYLQACAQGMVFVYWGWYWPHVYAHAHLILAQLLFAYAFDVLLSWTRRDNYTLGFAPFPVVFSINLFLWFKSDWFYLQFAMVALGLAAKELIRWNKDGHRVHIFNPSSFPLAVFSLILLAIGRSNITWGQDIASTQFYPPHMYWMLFLIGLPGQFFFGVTSMTMSAVVATYVFGRLYFAATGIYFFYDSYIPIAVFLGMHLLFTDPSTAPHSELGRIIYGTLYGLSTVALYQLLGSAGMPPFYDKLLQVPLLNLSVKGIDRITGGLPTLAGSLSPRMRNLSYISAWAGIFIFLNSTQGVGDGHPGQWLPFWRQACMEGRAYACPYVADLETSFCDRGSGWACNEAGLVHLALSHSGEDLRRLDPGGAADLLTRGCELGFSAACRNLNVMSSGEDTFVTMRPKLEDYPIILRGSKGEIRDQEPSALYALACHEGWPETCKPGDTAFAK